MNKELQALLNKTMKAHPKMIGDGLSNCKKCPIESPQMMYMLGGGIPVGRMIRLRGPESAGKSITCNYIAAQLQKNLPDFLGKPEKKYVIYVDFERTFDIRYAEEVGLDPEYVIHMKPENIEDFSDELSDYIKTDTIAAVIFDSDAAAPPRGTLVDPAGKATFGGQAKALGEFLRKYNGLFSDWDTTLLWISQERVNMTFGAHLPSCTGGEAPKFYASVVFRCQNMGQITDGANVIGINVRARNYKNKVGVPFRDALLKLYYKGGFNIDEEYAGLLVALDVIHKEVGPSGRGTGKFTNAKYGIEIKGEANIPTWCQAPENAELYEKLKQDVRDVLSGVNILDEGREMMNENGKACGDNGKALDGSDDMTTESMAAAALYDTDDTIGED